MRPFIVHGLAAGVLSALGAIAYQYKYQESLYLDFSRVIGKASVSAVSIFACLLMGLLYWWIERKKHHRSRGWLNLLLMAASFVSILVPIGWTLPLDVEHPELFIGLAIPMHFFPVLFFFGLFPFFNHGQASEVVNKQI